MAAQTVDPRDSVELELGATCDLFRDDPALKSLRDLFLAELPGAIHKRGGKRRAGDFTQAMLRLLDDRHITWARSIDPATGVIVLLRDGVTAPAHEAVKRLRSGRQDRCTCIEHRQPGETFTPREPPPPDYRWLRAALAWNGLPCLCNCEDVFAHLAMIDGTTAATVGAAVRKAARECLRVIGRMATRAGAPDARPAMKASYRRRRKQADDRSLPYLPRVFDPCGCTNLSKCDDHAVAEADAA